MNSVVFIHIGVYRTYVVLVLEYISFFNKWLLAWPYKISILDLYLALILFHDYVRFFLSDARLGSEIILILLVVRGYDLPISIFYFSVKPRWSVVW